MSIIFGKLKMTEKLMRNTYITITILTIIYLAALFYGFSQIGSPFEARHVKVDENRVRKLHNIKSLIENYYSTHRILPQNLSDLNITDQASIKDDVTNQFYNYQSVDLDSYQLCATFDTSNQKKDLSAYPPPSFPSFLHPKGYYCSDMEIPEYLKIKSNFQPIPPIQITPTPALFLPTPTIKIYFSPCGKYKTTKECDSAYLDGLQCSWYACKYVCLTTGTDAAEVCSGNTLKVVTE